MTEPVQFTARFELRPLGAAATATPVVLTGTGTMTVPVGVMPTTPAPAPVPPSAPATTGPLGKRIRLGAFVYDGIPGGAGRGDPWDPGPHLALEQQLGLRLDPVSCFIGWDTDFPAAQLAAYGTRDILISWHPDTPTAAQILSGEWDQYLDRWGDAVERYAGGQIYIRLMPEMNGSWSRWSALPDPRANPMGITDPAHYVRVWWHVVNRVRTRTNKIRWVFCPNITDQPATNANRLEEYYPGHKHVDVLGFDGYNWGNSGNGTHRWTTFVNLVGSPQGGATQSIYDRLTALHSTYPIWICEFGCKEPTREDGKADPLGPVTPGLSPINPGRSKSGWYSAALQPTGFPRLTTLVAFHVVKERDWRITSSTGITAAIAANMAR